MARVVVGLSGGVDSSVAALLLQQEGHEVIGLFMRNWYDESVTLNNECPWIDDSNDAMMVAERLGIPFQVLDLSKEYKERIVDYMFSEYEAGRTPNPDVLCNREIKFDLFLKSALKLGADYVATGHYCRKDSITEDGKTIYRLLAGMDPNKDQSYFLCQLTQEQLKYALFPVGELQKPRVRELAREHELVTADKKDSQGLCFIGKVRLPDFLQQRLEPKKGRIIEIPGDSPVFEHEPVPAGEVAEDHDLMEITSGYDYHPEDGQVIGEHTGAHFFTIGQRKGLNVGGKDEPVFVIGTDTSENVVYVGMGSEHPGLNRRGLRISVDELHWVREDLAMNPGDSERYNVRIRYRQPLIGATLHREANYLYIVFDRDVRGIAAGQFAAWYREDELIGSGVIN